MATEMSAEDFSDDGRGTGREPQDPASLLKAKRKAEKVARERVVLLEKLAGNITDTLTARVAWVLNHHPATRNSDVRLQVTYWRTFDHQWVSGSSVALENLYRLTRLTDITRARAKIQNEYHLFKATDEVRQRRGTREERERMRQRNDQPGFPTLTVYADER
jgi:hypothetical protein